MCHLRLDIVPSADSTTVGSSGSRGTSSNAAGRLMWCSGSSCASTYLQRSNRGIGRGLQPKAAPPAQNPSHDRSLHAPHRAHTLAPAPRASHLPTTCLSCPTHHPAPLSNPTRWLNSHFVRATALLAAEAGWPGLSVKRSTFLFESSRA